MLLAIEWIFTPSIDAWRLAAGGLAGCLLGALAVFLPGALMRVARWCGLVSLLLCTCVGLTWCKAAMLPSHPPVLLGSLCLADGTVMAVSPTRMGQSVTLHVRAVSPQTGSQPVRTAFLAKVLLQRSDPAVNPGDEVKLQGDFTLPPVASTGGIPVRRMLQQQGIDYELQGRVLSLTRPPLSMPLFRSGLPARIANAAGIPAADSRVLVSLLLGGVAVPTDVKQDFLRSGLLHLLAASGANVFLIERMISLCLYPLYRVIPFRNAVRAATLLAGTWLFVWLCGGTPSILRAGWMASYRQLGEASGRPVHTVHSLFVAMLLMEMWNPGLMLQAGTGLSIAATWAVAVALQSRSKREAGGGTSRTRQVARTCLGWGAGVIRTTLAVEALTLPLTLHWFGQLSVVSVAGNLLAEGLAMVILPLTVFCSLSVWLVPIGGASVRLCAHVLGQAADTVLHVLLSIVRWLSAWPYAFWSLSSFGWLDMACWYAGLVGLYWAWTQVRLWYNA